MITFILSIVALIVGYKIYGEIVDRAFGTDENNAVPSIDKADGIDYVAMPTWKALLIQVMNIAGTGPIFGAIAGAMWGPVAFMWIVIGCIFGGAVHDFSIGMISLRKSGASVAEIVGDTLGVGMRRMVIIFSIILLLLVGVVFISSPADLLADLTDINRWYFVIAILLYYLIATLYPIDKVIGKLYPIFGIALLIMAGGIIGGMLLNGMIFEIPELSFANVHPEGKSPFPYLCVSVACGAISGFHATQTPMMARCIANEKEGRKVFYGAMIVEGVIALIWAAAAMTFFGGIDALASAGSASVVVSKISLGLMGEIGMVLAILGVVACPITSGDTAFRALRLTIADALRIDQTKSTNRYKIVIPMFIVAIAFLFIDFNIIWRYFGWSNQTLACITLWAGAAYMKHEGKEYLICMIPAMIMTLIVTCYIMVAPEGFYAFMTSVMNIKTAEIIGVAVGVIVAISSTLIFIAKIHKKEE